MNLGESSSIMTIKTANPEDIKIWIKASFKHNKNSRLLINLKCDFFAYLNILGFLPFYEHNALPWN